VIDFAGCRRPLRPTSTVVAAMRSDHFPSRYHHCNTDVSPTSASPSRLFIRLTHRRLVRSGHVTNYFLLKPTRMPATNLLRRNLLLVNVLRNCAVESSFDRKFIITVKTAQYTSKFRNIA